MSTETSPANSTPTSSTPHGAPAADADLGLRSATELSALIRRRELGSEELLDHYLGRIERLNGDLNAVVTFDVERARDTARAADAATAQAATAGSGAALGALHGLPITVKDAIATGGLRTTGGATELADFVPDADAPVVSRVKDAGAVVFAKTNLPRWSGDVQAFNPMFGTTNNPWDLTRSPGGSSGGASAAVAAGLTSFEIGTDIGGSVRLPAHFAGVCGHKPSFGIVAQTGYIDHVGAGPGEADVNVVGPLARSVADLELLMGVMAGPTADRSAAWRLELPAPRHQALGDFRVAAWLDDPACPVGSAVGAALDAAVRALAGAGARVDREARPAVDFDDVRRVGLPLISAATSPGRTAEEFAELARVAHDPDAEASEAFRMRARASAIHHRDWLLLGEQRQRTRQVWADFFTRFDVLLCPVAVVAAFPHSHEGTVYTRPIDVDGVTRSFADLICWTSLIGYVYLPSTVVPVGWTADGLPVGIQIVAPYLEDRTALAFATQVERVLGGYRPPPRAQLA
ncbi:MAG: amidase [Acidimicrobiia bacterium]|nr:amidase [Acidimicrobiia bacterium]